MGEVPVRVLSDAKDRAWRTVLQGLGIDLATALVLSLAVLLTRIDWTWAFWGALGLAVAKSLIQATVAFFMRLLVKPKNP
jgi:hypothetical protein